MCVYIYIYIYIYIAAVAVVGTSAKDAGHSTGVNGGRYLKEGSLRGETTQRTRAARDKRQENTAHPFFEISPKATPVLSLSDLYRLPNSSGPASRPRL